jgi:F-type H+-transporting ATPase subunit b
MLEMAEFWVAIAFVVFLLILLYYKVPRLIAKALDDRAQAIRKELDEARRLREEARDLLADYKSRHRNVGREAEAIVEQARRETEAFAHETRASLKDTLERRTRLAEEKIARAEAQAVDEVRASAIDLALAAAEKILREKTAGTGGAALIDQSIRDLRTNELANGFAKVQ